MAAGQGVENYIEISDFTAGIQAAYMYAATWPGPSNQDGACQMSETYGCYGGKFGGLLPAPRLEEYASQGLFNTNTSRYPTGKAKAQIVAVYLASPVWPKTGSLTTNGDLQTISYSDNPDQLFVAYNWYFDATGGGTTWNRKYRLETYKLFQTTPTQYMVAEIIDNQKSGNQIAYGTGQFRFGFAGIDGTRSNTYLDTAPGVPHVVYTMGDYTRNKVIGAYPNPSLPHADGTDQSTSISSGKGANFNQTVFAHQGRTVFLENFNLFINAATTPPSTPFGVENVLGQAFGASGTMPASESIGYSDPNAFVAANVLVSQQLFVEENPSGYGTWQSMNANELFMVKQRGGGVVVRGDIARPTVVRIPSLPSVYGATNKGCLTDKGYVYGSKTGVYRWSGADTAEDIAMQMGGPYGGWFWKPEDNSTDDLWPGALHGTFSFAPPFVLAPNNFMLDTDTGAWWRVHPTPTQNSSIGTVIAHWQTSSSGKFYGMPAYISAAQTRLWSRFNPSLGANKYQWLSQPLAKTRNRTLNMREINVVTIGSGTVQIDIVGSDSSGVPYTAETHTFTAESAMPEIQFAPIKCQVQDACIRITSTGITFGALDVEAPTVLRVAIGYNTASSVSH